MARGLHVDDFAPRLSFFFNAQIDLFEEVAKYRAARRIWARELRDTFGARDERSWLMRFHTQTAGVSLTAQQPLNNVIRTTIEALAGVLGGTQSLHTNSYDEALALPTEEAVRLALRTQQVIAHESGVANTIDPLGGAYFVEALTDELERQAYDYFAKIDELGGMVEAVKRNFPQREIADAAFAYQQEVDEGKRIVVGVNAYREDGEAAPEILRIDPALERKQIGRLQAARGRRDAAAAERALAALKERAAGEANLMPALLDAARAHASEGEIVMRSGARLGVLVGLPVLLVAVGAVLAALLWLQRQGDGSIEQALNDARRPGTARAAESATGASVATGTLDTSTEAGRAPLARELPPTKTRTASKTRLCASGAKPVKACTIVVSA